ncbi:MAG: hypothetical protein VX835_04150 [Pseudomonadota bacterium]|nr:hypothetical protein [Pseudomonadota bacterium]
MIIVTRPMPWAKDLCDKLKSHKIMYDYLPAARLAKSTHQLLPINQGITVFLSQSSVLFAPDNLSLEHVFAVGPKTANAVETKYLCECYHPRPGHYSVSGLLEDPFFINLLEKNTLLNVIGGTHSDETRFESLNIKVHMYAVYDILPIDKYVSVEHQHAEIWFTSQKLMELFFDHYIRTLNQKNLLSYDIVVPTMVCQKRAIKLGFKGLIEVVADPRDESFLAHYQVKHRSE